MKLSSYHMFRFRAIPPGSNWRKRLIKLAPVPMSKVFFANSGSEANDSAIKLIWYYNNALGRTSKKKIIGRHGGYHGVTIASGSVTGLQRNHSDFDLPLPMMRHTACPHYWRFGQAGESESNSRRAWRRSWRSSSSPKVPTPLLAFFAEPVMDRVA